MLEKPWATLLAVLMAGRRLDSHAHYERKSGCSVGWNHSAGALYPVGSHGHRRPELTHCQKNKAILEAPLQGILETLLPLPRPFAHLQSIWCFLGQLTLSYSTTPCEDRHCYSYFMNEQTEDQSLSLKSHDFVNGRVWI